jgi:hypothetical protein
MRELTLLLEKARTEDLERAARHHAERPPAPRRLPRRLFRQDRP